MLHLYFFPSITTIIWQLDNVELNCVFFATVTHDKTFCAGNRVVNQKRTNSDNKKSRKTSIEEKFYVFHLYDILQKETYFLIGKVDFIQQTMEAEEQPKQESVAKKRQRGVFGKKNGQEEQHSTIM